MGFGGCYDYILSCLFTPILYGHECSLLAGTSKHYELEILTLKIKIQEDDIINYSVNISRVIQLKNNAMLTRIMHTCVCNGNYWQDQ